MKYQVVMKQGVATFPDLEQFTIYAQASGMTQTGTSAGSLRPELRGHPKYDDLAGPMAGSDDDGTFCARYETWQAHDLLSR